MDTFKDLLKIYSQKLNNSQLLIDEILAIINKTTNLKLNKSNINIRDGVGCFKLKPKEKLLIFLHKEKILADFKEEKINITDLR
ncbi:MAG TPA: hypothetical protein P5274_00780 [Candidatus Paceibacterota bacterium]|nr:hypothetical protein [Candidatus Paceibacterota bacterium]